MRNLKRANQVVYFVKAGKCFTVLYNYGTKGKVFRLSLSLLFFSFFFKNMSILFTRRFFVHRPLIQRSFASSSIQFRDLIEAPVKPGAPLEGIRVLDLTRVLGMLELVVYFSFTHPSTFIAGPYCTMMLGDMG